MKTMKEVLADHQQWVSGSCGPEDYCICDYHLDGASIEAHQADMLTAFGYGPTGRPRLVDINGRTHSAMCDRDRCDPNCPEKLLLRALRT